MEAVLRGRYRTEAISASIVCLGFSLALFWSQQAFAVATALWVVGLAGLVAAFLISDFKASRVSASQAGTLRVRLELALVLSLMLVGFLIRFIGLEHVPDYVHGDEGEHGLIARQIMRGEVQNLFDTGWSGLTFLNFAPYALSLLVFGDHLTGLRVASVLLGVAALPVMYLCLRPFYPITTAYAASLILAVSHLHVHFSRVGLSNITSPLFAVLALGLFLLGWRSGYKGVYLLAGLFTALGLLTYFGGLIVPITIGLITVFRLKEVVREKLAGYAAMASGALATIAPLLISYWKSPETTLSRVKGVWVFNNPDHVQSAYQTSDPITIAVNQLTRSYGALFGRGDTSELYHYGGGIADPVTAFLVVIGIGVMLWHWRDVKNNVFVVWLMAGLFFGATLTVDPPSYTRLLVLAPAVATIAAVGLDWLWRVLHTRIPSLWPEVPSLSWGLVLMAICVINLFGYFKVYPEKYQPPTLITEVALYMDSIRDRNYIYLGSRPVVSIGYPVFRFLAPDTQGEDYVVVPREVKSVPGLQVACVVLPHRDNDLPILRERFPNGKETRITLDQRNGYWTVYTLP